MKNSLNKFSGNSEIKSFIRHNISCRKMENTINSAQTAHEQPTDRRSIYIKKLTLKLTKSRQEKMFSHA